MEAFVLFYEKCRLCLDNPGVQDIFQTKDLPEDILMCIGVKVKSSDNLPQKICSNCLKIVNKAKELRTLATQNDAHLKSLFDVQSSDYHEMYDEEDSDRLVIAESSKESTPKKCVSKKANVREKNEDENSEKVLKNQNSIKVRKDLFESQNSSAVKTPADSVSRVNSKSSQSPDTKRFKKHKDEELKCEVCDKVFDKWKKLYLHRRLHNKKLSCPLDGCGKMFATKGDLERHLRIHTGVKPYHCDVCGQSFTQNGTLKSHIKSLHKELVE